MSETIDNSTNQKAAELAPQPTAVVTITRAIRDNPDRVNVTYQITGDGFAIRQNTPADIVISAPAPKIGTIKFQLSRDVAREWQFGEAKSHIFKPRQNDDPRDDDTTSFGGRQCHGSDCTISYNFRACRKGFAWGHCYKLIDGLSGRERSVDPEIENDTT
jgi:hypothetical protein